MANMRVLICDTNQTELEGHAKICRAICEKNNMQVSVMTFSSSKALAFEMDDPAFCGAADILIIEPDDGCEAVASYVRKKLGYKGMILYLSRSTDTKYFYGAFDANARSYIPKGDLKRFLTVFEEALQEAENKERLFIAVSYAGEYRNIDIRDIDYFETMANHLVNVNYAGGDFGFLSSLSELEDRLKDYGFMRVQRSFLVSMDSIHKISYEEVILNNGESIPVGRGNYAELKKAMDKWRGTGAAFATKAG